MVLAVVVAVVAVMVGAARSVVAGAVMEEAAMVVVAGVVVIMTASCTKYVEPSNVCRHQALPGTKVVAMHSFFCKRGYSLIRHHIPKTAATWSSSPTTPQGARLRRRIDRSSPDSCPRPRVGT